MWQDGWREGTAAALRPLWAPQEPGLSMWWAASLNKYGFASAPRLALSMPWPGDVVGLREAEAPEGPWSAAAALYTG
eukprot:gene3670-4240_t